MLDPCAIRNSPTWSPKISVQDRHHRTGSQLRRMSLEMESPNLPSAWITLKEKPNLDTVISPRYWNRGSHCFDHFLNLGVRLQMSNIFGNCGLLFFLLYHCQTIPNQTRIFDRFCFALSRSEVHINS